MLRTTVKKDGTMKWAKLLKEVDNPNYRAGRGSRYRLENIPLAVVASPYKDNPHKYDTLVSESTYDA